MIYQIVMILSIEAVSGYWAERSPFYAAYIFLRNLYLRAWFIINIITSLK